jgi:hypothetical protein
LCSFPFCGLHAAAAGAAAPTSRGFCCTTGLHGLDAFPSAQSEHQYIKKRDIGTINFKTPAQRPNMACLKRKFALALFHQLPQKIFPAYLSISFISKNLFRKDFFPRQISSYCTSPPEMARWAPVSDGAVACMRLGQPIGTQVGPRLDDQVINCRAKPTA